MPQDGYFVLIVPQLVVKDGFFRVLMFNAFKKQYAEIWLPFPARLNPDRLKEVRIHPKYNAYFFEVEFVSEVEPEPMETLSDSAKA
jgi:hypothetical protein